MEFGSRSSPVDDEMVPLTHFYKPEDEIMADFNNIYRDEESSLDDEVASLMSCVNDNHIGCHCFSPTPPIPILDNQQIENAELSTSRLSPCYRPSSPFKIVLEVQKHKNKDQNVEIPDPVRTKHFLPTGVNIDEESANLLSMHRNDTKVNSVFGPTDNLLLTKIETDPRKTFPEERYLYITKYPLPCYQSTSNDQEEWQTTFIGYKYGVFSGHQESFHFLKSCLEVHPENYELKN